VTGPGGPGAPGWWEMIDDGQGYVKSEDLARFALEPVQRGLVGRFEARLLPVVTEGTAINVWPDKSPGAPHDLTYDPAGLAPVSTYHVGPPAEVREAVGGGAYKSPDPGEFMARLTGASICWCGSLAVNNTVVASWGVPNEDSYAGLIVQPTLTAFRAAGDPGATGEAGPAPPSLGTAFVQCGSTDWIGGEDILLTWTGKVIRESAFYRRPPYSTFVKTQMSQYLMELGRGGGQANHRAVLFYAVALNPEELKQNAAYLAHVCRISD